MTDIIVPTYGRYNFVWTVSSGSSACSGGKDSVTAWFGDYTACTACSPNSGVKPNYNVRFIQYDGCGDDLDVEVQISAGEASCHQAFDVWDANLVFTYSNNLLLKGTGRTEYVDLTDRASYIPIPGGPKWNFKYSDFNYSAMTVSFPSTSTTQMASINIWHYGTAPSTKPYQTVASLTSLPNTEWTPVVMLHFKKVSYGAPLNGAYNFWWVYTSGAHQGSDTYVFTPPIYPEISTATDQGILITPDPAYNNTSGYGLQPLTNDLWHAPSSASLGIASPDASICDGSSATLTVSISTDGTGCSPVNYTIVMSDGTSTFSPTSQPTPYTATFLVQPTVTTNYTVVSVTDCHGCPVTGLPAPVVITVWHKYPGAIGYDQTICYNTAAANLQSVVDGSGDGTISYIWESFDGTNWHVVPGSDATFAPGVLTSDARYRRTTVVTNGTYHCYSSTTNVVDITVQWDMTAGTIAADQTICNGDIPAAFTSTASGTGRGSISYVWEYGDGTTWTPVPLAFDDTYHAGALTSTTYFRRITKSLMGAVTCSSDPTTPVIITVQAVVTAGVISADQTICNGDTPANLHSTTDGGGSGSISYIWEADTPGGWHVISGSEATYLFTAPLYTTTKYRRTTVSTVGAKLCYSPVTSEVTITVQDVVTAGGIAQNQTVCYGGTGSLTSSPDGTGSGTITYIWESNDCTGWTVVPGVNTATYGPTDITVETSYRRMTVSTVGAKLCYSGYTNVVRIVTRPNTVKLRIALQGAWNCTTQTWPMYTFLAAPDKYYPSPVCTKSYTGIDIVDWVAVGVRTAVDGPVLDWQIGRLDQNGYIVEPDGSNLNMPTVLWGHSYWLVVVHRNHLAIQSATAKAISCDLDYDFTTPYGQAYKGTQEPLILMPGGVYAMIAGNTDGNTLVQANDWFDWQQNNGLLGYYGSDMNLDSSTDSYDTNTFWAPNNGHASQVPDPWSPPTCYPFPN